MSKSKRFLFAAMVHVSACSLYQGPAWAAGVAAPLGEVRANVPSIAALPPAGQAEFAEALNLVIAGLPKDPVRMERALVSRARSDRPAADIMAAEAVLAALRDSKQEEKLFTELSAVTDGAKVVDKLKQLLVGAPEHRKAMAQAAAAAVRAGGEVFDGTGETVSPSVEAAGLSGARASGLKPSVRLFHNTDADLSFDEFLKRVYRNEPDQRANKIAAVVFTDLTEHAPRPFAGRAQTAGEMLRVLSRDFGEKTSVLLVGSAGSGRKTQIDHVAAGIRAGIYDLDMKVLDLDLPRLARLYTQPVANGQESPYDIFFNKTLPPLADRSVIVVRGAERVLEGDAEAILQLLQRPMERDGQRFIFVLEDEKKLPAGLFLRKFAERIEMPELEERAATQMLLAHKAGLEAASEVKILDAAIEELVSISKTVLNRLHPQELIDNLSRALGSRTQRTQRNEAQAAIADLYSQLSLAAAKHRRTKSVKDYNEVIRLAAALDAEQEKLASPQALELSGEHVRHALARQYPKKAPLILGNADYKKRLLAAIPKLHERIIGQDEPVEIVSEVLETVAMGLADDKGTMGNFLFLGPSGVGKTEVAKALAEAYTGDEENLVRLDMSEYAEKHNVSRLNGPPPGYEGNKEGGKLTNAVEENPESVVLWDEIEKGHEDVYDMGLQIFDDGRLTNGQGKTVDFHRTIQIMTANLCRDLIAKMIKEGASGEEIKKAVIEKLIEGELVGKKFFKLKPEFLNRLDGIVIFLELEKPVVIRIGELQARMLIGKPLAKSGHEFEMGPGVLEYVADHGGYDKANGARPMARAIRERVRGAVKEYLKKKTADGGELGHLKIKVDMVEGRIVVKSEPRDEAPPTKNDLPEGKLGDWARSLLDAGDQYDLSADAVQGSYQDEVRAPAPAPAARRAKAPLPPAKDAASATSSPRQTAVPTVRQVRPRVDVDGVEPPPDPAADSEATAEWSLPESLQISVNHIDNIMGGLLGRTKK